MIPIKEALLLRFRRDLANGSSVDPVEIKKREEDEQDIRRVNLAMLSALGASAFVLLMIGWKVSAIGPIFLWGIASVAAGASIGFLFGIPRVTLLNSLAKDVATTTRSSIAEHAKNPQAATPPPTNKGIFDAALRPNTNLEEVSDWLTKIIVGLGLVHLKDIQIVIANTASNAAGAIATNPAASDVSIATALIVGFGIEGFFGGYIYTRLFLQGAFARSDDQLRKTGTLERSDVELFVARAPLEEPNNGEKDSVPSSAQVKAATEVERLSVTDPRATIEKMEELAREYEQVRSSMPSGLERTRRMTEVVGRMTVVALGAASQLPRFSTSTRPGDRLAAVVILKLRFDAAYCKWLAERLVEDPPFIGFQAASALLVGSRLLGGSQLENLRVIVNDANNVLREKGWNNDPSRDRLIAQILAPTPKTT